MNYGRMDTPYPTPAPDTSFEGQNLRKISKSVSMKTPQVGPTISQWKQAKTRKSFKQRCTRSETGGFCMTNIGIITVAMLFCSCIPPNIFREDATGEKWFDNPGRLIVFALALTSSSMSLLCLWLTYITDPGVIPRRAEMEMRMISKGERICEECNIIRPRKGHHCRQCDHCVKVFDHHCPYAGVCIGNGNYLFFVLLLFSGMISSTYVSIFSIWFLYENWPGSGQSWQGLKFQLIVGVLLSILCITVFLLIAHLSLYHVFIFVKGTTTKERIKTMRSKRNEKMMKELVSPSHEPLLGIISQETSGWDTTSSIRETKEYTAFDNDTSAGHSRVTDL